VQEGKSRAAQSNSSAKKKSSTFKVSSAERETLKSEKDIPSPVVKTSIDHSTRAQMVELMKNKELIQKHLNYNSQPE